MSHAAAGRSARHPRSTAKSISSTKKPEKLLERADWKQLRQIWFAIAGSLALVLLFPPAAGIWFGCWVLWAVVRGGNLVPGLIFASTPITLNVMPGGVNLSVAEVGLVIAAAGGLAGKSGKLGPLLVPTLAYLAICMISMIVAFRGTSAIVSMVQTTIYLFLTVSVFSGYVRDRQQVVVAAVGLMGVSGFLTALSLSQGGGGYLFGIHKNNLGATTAVAVICGMGIWLHARQSGRARVWTLILGFLSLGLFMTLSRGAWASAVVGGFFISAVYRQWGVILFLGLLGCVVVRGRICNA